MSDPFAVQLAHRLRGHDPQTNPALAWLDRRLEAQGTTVEAVVRDELHKDGMANATVRNIVTSLRVIAGVDWTDLFEQVSPVDAVLAEAAPFAGMDFTTRNLYRTAIEALARGSDFSEVDIARKAASAAAEHPEGREADPGLLPDRRRPPSVRGGDGIPADAPRLVGANMPQPGHLGLRRGCRDARAGLLSPSAAVHLSGGSFTGRRPAARPVGGRWLYSGVGRGRRLRKSTGDMGVRRDGSAGHDAREWHNDASLRTLVAVPILLTTEAAVADQVARLEVHHLASRDGEVHFALLSDWTDSTAEHAATDVALLAAATSGIARLNRLYGQAPGGDRFLLLHRSRVWNAGEDALDRLGAQARQAA